MKLINGICMNSNINGVNVIKNLIFPIKENSQYINKSDLIKYIILCSNSETTPHFSVYDKCIVQNLPFDNEKILIEIADKGDFNTIRINTVKLICEIMRDFDIPVKNVLPYRYFSDKKILSPRCILKSEENWKSNWCFFQFLIMREYEKLY